uniref:ORF80 n=1 Tax=Malaco herpesvirus 4 TaxID=3031800 RepID=A0AA48P903_9VIRU|nr:TPA_asm: ORF80 [Malaco herpesvirus 4]
MHDSSPVLMAALMSCIYSLLTACVWNVFNSITAFGAYSLLNAFTGSDSSSPSGNTVIRVLGHITRLVFSSFKPTMQSGVDDMKGNRLCTILPEVNTSNSEGIFNNLLLTTSNICLEFTSCRYVPDRDGVSTRFQPKSMALCNLLLSGISLDFASKSNASTCSLSVLLYNQPRC